MVGRTVIGLVAGVIAVLLVEFQLARSRPKLAPTAPLRFESPVGASEPGDALRVVWLGDSTAAGVGASSPEASLPHQVAERLGRPVELTVFAESGARVGDVVAEQLPRVTDLRPDVVVVAVGANDTTHLTRRSRFAEDYRRILDGLGSVRHLIVLGVPDMGAPPRLLQPLRAITGWRGRALDAEVRAEASRHDATSYVDIAGRTGPVMRADHDRYFATDGYHPSDAGYRLWADAVVDVLAPLVAA